MTPLSFDHATSKACVGDERTRAIEAKARNDADKGVFELPKAWGAATYWDGCKAGFEASVYREQHRKRVARNERKQPTDDNHQGQPA